MATKIVIDAGHGGSVDPGAVYKGREEKNDNLNLAMAVGKILSENGVDVVYTRTDDTYQTPFEKAQIANEDGADFFLSFHRNSSPLPNQYSGAESLVYDLSGTKAELAKNINGALGELGFKDLGVSARPGLVVLRRTRMPAVLIETGFINNDSDNALFDKKFDDIAEAIAYAILGTLAETKAEITTTKGIIRLHAYVHANDMVMLVQTNATDGEKNFRWEWIPASAQSPRYLYAKGEGKWIKVPEATGKIQENVNEQLNRLNNIKQ